MKLSFKIHTPRLLDEILNSNDSMGIFSVPINVFANLLAQVAQRASELNDPILNHLMCELTLYEIADPYNANYDKAMLEEIERLAELETENEK